MFLEQINQIKSAKISFLSDKFNFLSVGIGLLVNIIHWAILIIKIKPTNQSLLLHYNVVYGSDLVDKAKYAYYIPAIALAFFVINMMLAAYYFNKEKMAARFLACASIAVQLVFLTASIVLIIANA